jgi:hypothetical protein
MSRHLFHPVIGAPLDSLLLDTANPRIRSAKTQQECIDRVMRKQTQMMNLIKSIAQDGLGTMPILLYRPDSNREEWIVKDGNRRVTALKLLNEPSRCSDKGMRDQIEDVRNRHKDNIPLTVDCLESADPAVLAREVLARHGGAMDGVGQLGWEAYLRTVFQIASNMAADNKRAGQYLLWAEANGIPVEDDFPVTTLTRFFSEANLKRLGFAIEDDQLVPNLPQETVRQMVLKVVTDFGINKKNVSDVFTADLASGYIDQVREAVGEPNDTPTPTPPQPGAGAPNPQDPASRSDDRSDPTDEGENNPRDAAPRPPRGSRPPSKPAWDRTKLFWRGSPAPSVPNTEIKVRQILFEISRIPKTQDMPLTCAMLMRALLEATVNDYMSRNSIRDKGNLSKNTTAVADSLFNAQVIDKSLMEVVKAYAITDRAQVSLFNIDTIQKYIHRDTHLPGYTTLHTMWDEIGDFIRACWATR